MVNDILKPSAMFKFLKIALTTQYYEDKQLATEQDEIFESAVIEQFKNNKEYYGHIK